MIAGDPLPSQRPSSLTSAPAAFVATGASDLRKLADQLAREQETSIELQLRRIERLIMRLVQQHGLNYFHLKELVEQFVELASQQREYQACATGHVYPTIREILDDKPPAASLTACFLQQTLAAEDAHLAMAAILAVMRGLTEDYKALPAACAKYRALMEALSHLDSSLQRHWEQEEGELFPQLLELGRTRTVYSGD